jgi:hypothetical protein
VTGPGRHEAGKPAAAPGLSGYLVAGAVLFVVAPLSLVLWAAGAEAVRRGARRWHLGGVALALAAVAIVLGGPSQAADGLQGAADAFRGVPLPPPTVWALLGPLALAVGRLAVASVLLAAPVGLAAAAVPPGRSLELRPEWGEQEKAARRRATERARRRADRAAVREAGRPEVEAFAVALEPSRVGLAEWRRKQLVVLPPGQLGRTNLLVGASGFGKTTALERIAYLAAGERRHLTVIDGKGGEHLDETIVAAVLAAWPDARIALFDQQPYDLWRGDAAAMANKLVAAWTFTDEAEFYEQAAMLGLRLALSVPGQPCRSSAELVLRLQPSWLQAAWQSHPAELGLIRDMEKRLGDVAVRMGNLAAGLGRRFDGAWSLDDVDVAVFTIPTMANPKDGDAAMRVLLAEYGQWLATRRERRPSLLAFDEFGTVRGGREYAINLVERARSANAGVLLSAQSAAGLGDGRDRERLVSSAHAAYLFRSALPAELAALAGTERVAEGAWSYDQARTPDGFTRVTVTERARSKLDQDLVRQARPGEVAIICGGQVERAKVIRTVIAPEARERARGLSRPLPAAAVVREPAPTDGPAGAVVSRELPAPAQPRQGASPAPRRPSGGLDPSGPGPVRRYRPLGPSGEAAPPDDHEGVPE